MKKNYISPQVAVATVQLQSLLTDSKSIWSEGTGIGFGGIDTGGSHEPGSRYRNSVWDDEEEDW